jgi:thioredoxin 1
MRSIVMFSPLVCRVAVGAMSEGLDREHDHRHAAGGVRQYTDSTKIAQKSGDETDLPLSVEHHVLRAVLRHLREAEPLQQWLQRSKPIDPIGLSNRSAMEARLLERQLGQATVHGACGARPVQASGLIRGTLPDMNPPHHRPEPALLVACLCAAWCRTCGDYRATFDALAVEFGPAVHAFWVDIEDDEQALGGIEVDDFPTLLIARGEQVCFFGPVTPHAQTARQLVRRALLGELATVDDPGLSGLAGRVLKLR